MQVKDSQRPPNPVRETPPCKGCSERYTACSDHCPKDERGEYGYLAWRAARQAVEDRRKAYNALNRRPAWELRHVQKYKKGR